MSTNKPNDQTATDPGSVFKQKLRRGDALFGMWCAIDSTATVEAMTTTGVDWIMIDCEHGIAAAENCLPLIQAADRNDCCVFVRVPRLDPGLIARLLDSGAHGIMLPKVSTAATARALVNACRYPPQGDRGIGPHRATGYYSDFAGYLEHANERTVIVAQIEQAEAVENLNQILTVDGIDVAFVGPADLSASLGHVGDPQHLEVEEVVAQIAATCVAVGVGCGYYCGSGKEAKSRTEAGFQMVNVAQDLGTLVHTVRRQLKAASD